MAGRARSLRAAVSRVRAAVMRRMRGRRRARSVRSRLVLLLVPPVTALVAVWGVAAAGTVRDNLRQTRAQTFQQKVLHPTDEVIAALQDERRMSLSYLGDDATIGRAGFDAQRAVTDRARTRFARSAADDGIAGATRPATRQRMTRLARALGGLEALRAAVDARRLDRAQALTRYTAYIELAADIYDDVHATDPELVRRNRILRTLERARESLAREDALVTGALAAGRLTQDEHLQLVRFAGAQRFLYEDAARGLAPADRARYDRITAGPDFRRFQELEERLMRAGPSDGPPPVDIGAWHTTTETVDTRLAGLSSELRSEITRRAGEEAGAVLLRLGLMGGLGLVAVVAAILLAARAARRLVVESRALAASVTAFAHHRLPRIGERARRGEDVSAEVGPGAAGPGLGTDGGRYQVTEIEQIDRAFAEARRAVVAAAEREAAAHRRLNEVFVTLARRNQSLLQRLLRKLESMQRRTQDPDELQRLFELDSLATRMRRHAEGLVILSGRPSGRTWRTPVRLVDVARAAAAEIEDYARVEVVPMGRTALHGPAVADTIHLLAELMENAAAFSPPSTPVRVTGERVAHGFAVEVEDRGLGLDPERMEELNRLLATDPELDLDDSARLGLYVVARLAARHGIRVTLRSSAYGGVIAIVLLPNTLVVEPDESAGRGRPARRRSAEQVPFLAAPVPAVQEPAAGAGAAGRPADPSPGSAQVPGQAAAPSPSSPGSSSAADAVPVEPSSADSGPGGDPGAEMGTAASTEASAEANTGAGASPTTVSREFPLPTRRRQTHLAPQLRGVTGTAGPAPEDGPGGVPAPRSPEAMREMLATMQRGWQRGRAEASGTAPGGGAATPPGAPAGDARPSGGSASGASGSGPAGFGGPGDADGSGGGEAPCGDGSGGGE